MIINNYNNNAFHFNWQVVVLLPRSCHLRQSAETRNDDRVRADATEVGVSHDEEAVAG